MKELHTILLSGEAIACHSQRQRDRFSLFTPGSRGERVKGNLKVNVGYSSPEQLQMFFCVAPVFESAYSYRFNSRKLEYYPRRY